VTGTVGEMLFYHMILYTIIVIIRLNSTKETNKQGQPQVIEKAQIRQKVSGEILSPTLCLLKERGGGGVMSRRNMPYPTRSSNHTGM
jgi:hypothetical protein